MHIWCSHEVCRSQGDAACSYAESSAQTPGWCMTWRVGFKLSLAVPAQTLRTCGTNSNMNGEECVMAQSFTVCVRRVAARIAIDHIVYQTSALHTIVMM